MLILARRTNESIVIDGEIEITVLEARNGMVRLGIAAPRKHKVLRKELVTEIAAENRSAAVGQDPQAALKALGLIP